MGKFAKVLSVCIMIFMLVTACGTEDNAANKSTTEQKQITVENCKFYVTSNSDFGEDALELDDYNPCEGLGGRKETEDSDKEKEFQIGDTTYTAKIQTLIQFADDTYWAERYALNEIEGEAFQADAYEVSIVSHLDNLENEYVSDNNLDGFTSVKENDTIDKYEVTYQKKIGEFNTGEMILVEVEADGSVTSFTAYSVNSFAEYQNIQVDKEALEEEMIKQAQERCEQNDLLIQDGISSSKLIISESGQLVYEIEVEVKAIDDVTHVHPITVYAVFQN